MMSALTSTWAVLTATLLQPERWMLAVAADRQYIATDGEGGRAQPHARERQREGSKP